MIDVENLYFNWLVRCLDDYDLPSYVDDLCSELHQHDFLRRVHNDSNRADDGRNLRLEFLDDYSDLDMTPEVENYLMDSECTWLEMMVALARHLDFSYDGSVGYRFLEMATNAGMIPQKRGIYDAIRRIDNNEISRNGVGGLFPLIKKGHSDQREVEIWAQAAAYFSEKLEGVMWTSTK